MINNNVHQYWRFELIFIFLVLVSFIFLYCYYKRNVKLLQQRKDNDVRQVLITIQERFKKNPLILSNKDICKSSSQHNRSVEQMFNTRLDGTISILNKYDPNKLIQTLPNISFITTDKSKQIDYSIRSQNSTDINLIKNKNIVFNKNHLSNNDLKPIKQIIIDLEPNVHMIPSTPSCTSSIDENSNLAKNN
ncbi:unnamed protein product [Rotaria sp. Silwood1]|nr:unnamed protein product [Rotaria sp. Silwood1]